MMLSVIIVNYNVEHFLDACLNSVRKAVQNIDAEVFVVDNNSVDGSLRMLRERYPEVQLIANTENLGFSKANNQAMRIARGKYILLLNPDTVVEHDTFQKVVNFMELHPDAGGLGVKMVDGKGRFLPESKRGLPTPMVAFYKIFGFSRLFPRSKRFGRYHLGYLDENQTHEVDILSGAFMLMRQEALDKAGLLDESFFMYGEDIDLSWRIIKAGYRNYYYPEARIIHYKGESTRKTSVNYVFMFYNAMVIFARKHFSQRHARVFSFLIHLAIYFRAGVALISRLWMRAATPLLDVLLLYGGNVIIKEYWEQTIKAEDGVHYPLEFMLYVLPSYILIWLFSSYLSGAYDRPVKPLKAIRGVVAGTLAILVIYALLPEGMRFSRALILLGAVWAMISLPASRVLLHLSGLKYFRLAGERNKRFAVAGSREEIERVREILNTTYPGKSFIAPVSLEKTGDEYFTGHLEQLTEICAIYGIDEVVFCSKDIPSQTIITLMTRLNAGHTDFKIAPADSIALIGSSSIHTAGDVYIHSLQTVISPQNRRNKRLTDLVTSLILLVLLPIIIWFTGKPGRTLIHLLQVFSGKKTWVGYNLSQGVSSSHLPPLKPAVLQHRLIYPLKNADNETLNRLNMLYARDYTFSQDIAILIRCIKYIGR